jgi:copper homeostasis protein
MTVRRRITLEICAYSVEAAIAAQAGGADRVELCANPSGGGTTPSYGSIVVARQNLKIELHVLIRPRGGDFLYSPQEFAAMKEDVQLCRQSGVEGVVLGILLPNARVDKERCRELVRLASPMPVTFHRAFDMTADALQALEDVIETGCRRILTSGQANSALEGASLIAELVRRAGRRIIIMAGAGVNEENFAKLIESTGAEEFHTSARTVVASKMLFSNPNVSLGSSPEKEYELLTINQNRIKKMREIANQLSSQ